MKNYFGIIGRNTVIFMGCTAGCALSASAGDTQGKEQSNIIVIFTDDAGYADFGFTGSKDFKTPHIDRLASEGISFTNAYVSSAVCGPSRAGLITGKYQQRFGFVHNNVPGAIATEASLPTELMGLPFDQRTIADHLGELGYKSIIIGKWHLGHGDGFHPLDRGFTEFYGFLGGARDYFASDRINEERRMWRNRDHIPEPTGYLTDHFADEACRFILNNKESPFFLFLSFNAPHTPLQAKEEDLALFDHVSPNQRKILAAMTWSVDQAVGKVMSTLEELGLDENTLVIFTNDNGGTTYFGADNSPFSGTKSTHLEGGIRVPFIMKWKNHLNAGQTYDYPIITLDILPTSIALAGGDPGQIEGLDGVNLLPYITGENKSRPHETLYWSGDGCFSAIRHNDWKLIKMPDRLPELYNLADDPAETNNLALEQLNMTQDLLRKLFTWENANGQARWQLQKQYEVIAIERFDAYRK